METHPMNKRRDDEIHSKAQAEALYYLTEKEEARRRVRRRLGLTFLGAVIFTLIATVAG
tara:strand:+ start:44 stop:220 length:177 start_codon:yes stop_codon:yes gene_type:complete